MLGGARAKKEQQGAVVDLLFYCMAEVEKLLQKVTQESLSGGLAHLMLGKLSETDKQGQQHFDMGQTDTQYSGNEQ